MTQQHSPARPVQLHVIHDLGGGSAKWLADYCKADTSRTNLVLRSFAHDAAMAAGLALYPDPAAETPIKAWKFADRIAATTVAHEGYRAALAEIVRDHGVQALVVSSVIGHSLEVLETGLPTAIVCHDYFPWCPAINLYYDGICARCDGARLTQCAHENSDFNPFAGFPAAERLAVRERFVELAQRPNVKLVAPSESVVRNLKRLEARWATLDFALIPHGYGEPLPHVDLGRLGREERPRVVVLGQLSVAKGRRVLEDALPQITLFADVYMLGAREVGEFFKYMRHVHVVSDYELRELPGHVAAIRPHVALLTSIVSESFGYALSELFMLGVPALATRVGAYADRIEHGVNGYLCPPEAAALASALGTICADRDSLDRVRSGLKSFRHRGAAEMVADYHRLLPLEARALTAVSVGALERAEAVEAVTIASMWKHVRATTLQMTIINDARQRGEAQWREEREHLEERLARLRADVARRQVQLSQKEMQVQHLDRQLQIETAKLEEIYSSTSWGFSSPVRWMGNNFPAIRKVFRSALGLGPARSAAARKLSPDEARLAGWNEYRETFARDVRPGLAARVGELERRPLISVIVPVFNPVVEMFRAMLDSVRAQVYPEWELCVADDGSTEPYVREILEDYARRDSRIRVSFTDTNGGVASASNRALAMATGEYVVLLDHDDLIEEHALFRVAESILDDDPDMVYSDEALTTSDGHTVIRYALRPAFSLEYLRSHPYIVHLVGFRASLLRELGGWDEKMQISQDYDLILRVAERARKIVHIPEVLYRWRIHGSSAGIAKQDQVMEVSKGVLRRHLERSGVAATVEDGPSFNLFSVRYPLQAGLKVAIIIPTKNHGELLRQCIESIRATVTEAAYDIIVVDHESDEKSTLDYLASIARSVRVVRYAGPFNFSAINNWAVKQLEGEGGYSHYLLCNNDIEALEQGWLERMLELGQQADVGMVGAELFYPDRKTIQHAGVCVGMFGVAEHYGKRVRIGEDQIEPGFVELLSLSHEVAAVTAALVLIRKDAWDKVRGFDESIAVGFGDIDLCLRVSAAGWRIVFCPHAQLVHHESFTRGTHEVDPHPVDSKLFRAKWKDFLEAGDPYYSPGLSLSSCRWELRYPMPCFPYVRRRVVERDRERAREHLTFSPAVAPALSAT